MDQWPETRAVIRAAESWEIPDAWMDDSDAPPSLMRRLHRLLKRIAVEYKSADRMMHSGKVVVLIPPCVS
jgi:hypothetical protein